MEWIGCIVCEIFAFKLYCDLETGVRGHSRSSKAALFVSARTTLYSSSIRLPSLYYRFQDIAEYWSKIATPLYSAPQVYATTLGNKKLVGAYARGPAFSWVHCQHVQQTSFVWRQQQKTIALGKPDVDLFIARTGTNQPAKVTVPSWKLGKEFRWYVHPFWYKPRVWWTARRTGGHRRTDGIAVAYTRYSSILAVARKN